MSKWPWKTGAAVVAIAAATSLALAQMPERHEQMHGGMGPGAQHGMSHAGEGAAMGGHMMQMMHGRAGMHGHMGALADRPTMAGQDAFGTIQEVVQLLEADPATDWSKVNIGALREHLIDMNEVTLRAAAEERAVEGGVEITVTGEGRTVPAIKRMVPAHAHELSQIGWNARTKDLPNGVKLTVTSSDPAQATRIRALGFMGIMVQGSHHQSHHLMMAKGEFVH